MLIILEGPDCAGKSTLAENLAERIIGRGDAYHLFRAGPPGKTHPLDAYVTPLLRFWPDDIVICDRWHVGERVYPTVMGRPSRMTPGIFDYIELFLQSRGATTLLLDQTDEVLIRRFDDRGDDYVGAGQLLEAAHSFRVQRMLLRTRTVQPPTMVLGVAETRAANVRELRRRYVTWVGSPQPDVLLMGDVRACDGLLCRHRDKHDPAGPAFMPYDSTSGAFLFGALYPLPTKVAVANACDVDDAFELWRDLERPKIVALGVKAATKLASYGLSFAAVPHPQYVRRFHHGARAEYGQLIKNVIGTERNELKWRPQLTKPFTVKTSTALSSGT